MTITRLGDVYRAQVSGHPAMDYPVSWAAAEVEPEPQELTPQGLKSPAAMAAELRAQGHEVTSHEAVFGMTKEELERDLPPPSSEESPIDPPIDRTPPSSDEPFEPVPPSSPPTPNVKANPFTEEPDEEDEPVPSAPPTLPSQRSPEPPPESEPEDLDLDDLLDDFA